MFSPLRKLETRCDGSVAVANRPRALDLTAAVLVLLLGLTWSAAGFPRTAADNPGAFVQSLGDEVITILRNRDLNTNNRRISLREIFKKSFDTTSMARFVLGRYRRTATDVQKAEYLKIFPEYVADIYAGQFSTYSGEMISVLKVRKIDEKRSIVNAEIRRPEGTTFRVDFRVRRGPAGFRIIDVIVERISLLITKRAEFSTVIRREGMDGLLERLRRQTEKVLSKPAGGP